MTTPRGKSPVVVGLLALFTGLAAGGNLTAVYYGHHSDWLDLAVMASLVVTLVYNWKFKGWNC